MPRNSTTGNAVKQSSCTPSHIIPHSFMMSFLDELCDRAWWDIDKTISHDDEYEDPATGLTWQLSAIVSFNEGYREPSWVEVYDADIHCVDENNEYVEASLSKAELIAAIDRYLTRRLLESVEESDAEAENLRNLEYQFNLSRI